MKATSYRADIDGLRAISALSIFAFHLGFDSFSGGFVGVDIFFVISGYLIVPKIIEGLEANDFSLARFFEKRIRRILPALLLVLLFSVVVGYFLLGPREYKEFALSALATLGFAANFFFNDRSDYFADVSHQKPFLHAWSLGVEEQFYILIPLLLIGIYKLLKWSPRKAVIIITALSFIYNLVIVRIDETNAFYLPMSRFWELGLGGLIALYTPAIKLDKFISVLVFIFGLGLIGLSLFWIDDTIRFPGEAALLPVLGSGLIILAGQTVLNPASRFLGSFPFRYLGRLSYSIYLIHWPVIVFVRLYISRPFNPTEQLLIFVFGILWAVASWHLMESYLLDRRRVCMKPLLLGVASALAIIGGTAWAISLSNGAPARMTAEALKIHEAVQAEKELPKRECETVIPFSDSLPKKYSVCSSGNQQGQHILFWGDSHSGMLIQAFNHFYGTDGNYISSTGMPDCPPIPDVETTRRKNRDICPTFVNEVMNYLDTHQVDMVVLASRWANLASTVRAPGDGGRSHTIFDLEADGKEISFKDALNRTVKEIKARGANVLIVGPVPEIQFHVPDTVIRHLKGYGNLPIVKRSEFDVRQSIVMNALTKLEKTKLVDIIYPHNLLCDQGSCEVFKNGNVLYTDDDHLSLEGARPIVDALRDEFKR
ncbi:acyltransferase family protein [Sneathiella limimaris]|uniref:acyltransferase family protein n=1 Tax=Sneathiella limimaris TaxID=1964213 RepID=UPI00146F63FD|nr:acyltransferase family protein [Sneathiella limimaris]